MIPKPRPPAHSPEALAIVRRQHDKALELLSRALKLGPAAAYIVPSLERDIENTKRDYPELFK